MPKSKERSSRSTGLRGMDIVAFVPTTNPARARTFFETTLGLRLVSEDPWTSPSQARIAWFKDPEGNVLSLTQY
jgi:catechol 2,3-dioxygenase-like lactoylglutathione lyase family enzyme